MLVSFFFWAPRPTAVGLCAGSLCSVLLSREASRLYVAPALRAAATIPGAGNLAGVINHPCVSDAEGWAQPRPQRGPSEQRAP
jgi:hypothetical protein